MENKNLKIIAIIAITLVLAGQTYAAQINKLGRPTPRPGVQGFKVESTPASVPTKITKPLPPTPSKRTSAGGQATRTQRPASTSNAETASPEFDAAMKSLNTTEALTPLNTQKLAAQKLVSSLGSNVSTKGIETAMSTLTKLYKDLSSENPDLASIAQTARSVATGAGLKQSEKTQKNIQAVKAVRQLAIDIANATAQIK